MVNFAELKAKAEKAKDASLTKVTNTRDRFSSAPSSKANWDPSWKRTSATTVSTSGPPPPPSRSRPDVTGPAPPAVPRASRPSEDVSPPPAYTPPPPPTRITSGYPPSHRLSQHEPNKIDWTNLSAEDKETFFGWLDEFFSQYLKIELSPRAGRSAPVAAELSLPRPSNKRPPPMVNMATRPQV